MHVNFTVNVLTVVYVELIVDVIQSDSVSSRH